MMQSEASLNGERKPLLSSDSLTSFGLKPMTQSSATISVDTQKAQDDHEESIQDLIRRNDVAALEALITKDPQIVTRKYQYDAAPLHIAASLNNLRICKLLVDNRPSDVTIDDMINMKGGQMEATPLLWAVRYCSKDHLVLCLDLVLSKP
jgi:ankyrin repeat protein